MQRVDSNRRLKEILKIRDLNKYYSVIINLLEDGANADMEDGRSGGNGGGLIIACERNDEYLWTIFRRYGASVETIDYSGNTVLHVAVKNLYESVFFIESCVNANVS